MATTPTSTALRRAQGRLAASASSSRMGGSTTFLMRLVSRGNLQTGTWTINPDFSLVVRIANVLPAEEFLFFLLTSTLIVFTVALLQSPQAADRLAKMAASITARNRMPRVE